MGKLTCLKTGAQSSIAANSPAALGSGPAPIPAAKANKWNVKEATAAEVARCQPLGRVAASNSVFVGLSAALGKKNARSSALKKAAALGATHVLWSALGTSMTSEWVGDAYRC